MKLAAISSTQRITPTTPTFEAVVDTAKGTTENFCRSTGEAAQPQPHRVLSTLGVSGTVGAGCLKTAVACGAGPLLALSAGLAGAAAGYAVAPILQKCAAELGDSLQNGLGMSAAGAELTSVVGVGGALVGTSLFAMPATASWLVAF